MFAEAPDNDLINTVPWSDVESELGTVTDGLLGGIEEVFEISSILENQVNDRSPNSLLREFRPRLAPSIVTRSLAGFFEMSMPRFAIRCNLDHHGSFANFHRAATMRRLAPAWTGKSPVSLYGSPGDFLWNRAYRVADAVLRVPSFPGSPPWRIAKAPHLPEIYGEPRSEGVDYTSYAKGLPLSGLCAQAVCFMASVMMLPTVRKVHGIAEITLEATQRADSGSFEGCLPLVGLNADQIEAYFSKRGARASYQGLSLSALRRGKRAGYRTESEEFTKDSTYFAAALRAYLRSGFPVIVPCDLQRFKGRPNAGWSGDPLVGHSESDRSSEVVTKSKRHVVLAIGYRGSGDNMEVLCHDPSTEPYMRRSVGFLTRAMPYANENGTDYFDRLVLASLFGLTPEAVKLPLGSPISNVGQPLSPDSRCLFDLARDVLAQLSQNHHWLRSLSSAAGETVLVTRASISRCLDALAVEMTGDAGTAARIFAAFTSRNGPIIHEFHGDRYFWLQAICSDDKENWTVLLWDAEQKIGTAETETASLVACRLYESGNWKSLFEDPQFAPAAHIPMTFLAESGATQLDSAEAAPLHESVRLKPSLITSFSALGVGRISSWPEGCGCELYAFMSQDLQDMGFSRHLENEASPVTQVASWSSGDISRIAERTMQMIQAAGISSGSVIGFATYVPEITSANHRQTGIVAIRNLVRLAGRMAREAGNPHSPVIELVGGSLSGVLRPATSPFDESDFVAEITSLSNALSGLFAALEQLADIAIEEGVVLALEFEPGPLNILGNFQTMCNIATVIGSSAKLRKCVGLNLDIAHFAFVEGISVADLRNSPVCPKIVHAHISDHADGGHFGDLPLLFEIHSQDRFSPWIRLLEEIAEERLDQADALPFSGHVSLELEAVPKYSHIFKSLENLQKIL